MNYKQIIAESWQYTQSNKRLIRWYGLLPALFTTTLAIGTLLYQFFSFRKSYLFGHEGEGFLLEVLNFAKDFLGSHLSWTIPIIIGVSIFGVFTFLLPPLTAAAAIQVIARDRNKQKASLSTGLKYGVKSYLQLLEYRAMMKVFSFMFILLEIALTIRYSFDFFLLLLPVFILFIFAGLVMSLLFTYADFYIIIDEEDVFDSIKKSTKLVVTNWKHTFLVTVLMMIIGVRIVMQVILVFLIPVLVILVTGYLSIVLAPGISLLIGAVLGFAGLLVSAYINGVVDIFSYTVWTYTFLTLTSQKEISAREVFSDKL